MTNEKTPKTIRPAEDNLEGLIFAYLDEAAYRHDFSDVMSAEIADPATEFNLKELLYRSWCESERECVDNPWAAGIDAGTLLVTGTFRGVIVRISARLVELVQPSDDEGPEPTIRLRLDGRAVDLDTEDFFDEAIQDEFITLAGELACAVREAAVMPKFREYLPPGLVASLQEIVSALEEDPGSDAPKEGDDAAAEVSGG